MVGTSAKSLNLLELPLVGTKPEFSEGRVGVGSGLEPELVLYQVLEEGISHVLQRDGAAFATEMKLTELMVSHPDVFMDFPIASILTPDQVNGERETALTQLRVKCSSWAERYTATDQLMSRLKGSVNSGLLDDIQIATLELISNALLHGPRDDYKKIDYDKNGKEFHNSQPLYLKPAFLSVAQDDERIVVSCRDLYGELDAYAFLRRVHRCYEYGVSLMLNHGEGGAGIGSFLLVNVSLGIYVCVKPKAQTVFCLTFPKRGGLRKRHAIPKNLHVHTFLGGK